MSHLHAAGYPQAQVRARARRGAAAVFPPTSEYGRQLFGAPGARQLRSVDPLDTMRLVPPVFTPHRLDKLLELGREPLYRDVDLTTIIGGFCATMPIYISAFGSTEVASRDLAVAATQQAARLGIPVVIGENVGPVNGTGRLGKRESKTLLGRLGAYLDALEGPGGGVAVQQSTEDADAEIWNLIYSDPSVQPLLDSGRLAFELKVGQGAKPGLGGMTVLDADAAHRIEDQYTIESLLDEDGKWLRSSSPGTFTQQILANQLRFMRNNFPRAKIWVKLPPARDVAAAAETAWAAGVDAVTVDGSEGGTGWAPTSFLESVGLPLSECLRRLRVGPGQCLMASGRIWEGTRAVKALAAGATAVGLGRAALIAVDEDPESGLVRFVQALAFELQLLISALGKYCPLDLSQEDLWQPDSQQPASNAPLVRTAPSPEALVAARTSQTACQLPSELPSSDPLVS
jgi:isopentenyl diphosphate isomerase/L-lactate dehydrogenase-like FMN-dependent dehydrogenase